MNAKVEFESFSDEFRTQVLLAESTIEQICDRAIFTEGPVWFAEGEYLLFSDLFGNKTWRWSETDGLSISREPTNRANGQTRDRQGRLVVAGHSSRTVYRFEHDGAMTLLADAYEGNLFNSPNDIVVKSDDTIWFTDPPYGLKYPGIQEQSANNVFRLDPDGIVESVADDFIRPNGLAFSPDESLLYIADSHRHQIRVSEVTPQNTLANGREFCKIHPGLADGMAIDTDGRVYSTAEDGIHVFNANGALLGKIFGPQQPTTNCTFGGPGRNILFMTSRSSVYRVSLATTGAQQP